MVRFRRLLLLTGSAGALLLSVYGGLLVVVGALVLSDVIRPDGPVNRRVLTWLVALWDSWFLVWGVALALPPKVTPGTRPVEERPAGPCRRTEDSSSTNGS